MSGDENILVERPKFMYSYVANKGPWPKIKVYIEQIEGERDRLRRMARRLNTEIKRRDNKITSLEERIEKLEYQLLGPEVMNKIRIEESKISEFNYICGLKERIFTLIDCMAFTSFFDLEVLLSDDFCGSNKMYDINCKNLILWDRMDERFIDVLTELILEGHVKVMSGDLANVAYAIVTNIGGRIPKFNMADRLKDYGTERWFPVVFRSGRGEGEEDGSN